MIDLVSSIGTSQNISPNACWLVCSRPAKTFFFRTMYEFKGIESPCMMDLPEWRRLSENLSRHERVGLQRTHSAAATAQQINIHVWPNVITEMCRLILAIFLCLPIRCGIILFAHRPSPPHCITDAIQFNLVDYQNLIQLDRRPRIWRYAIAVGIIKRYMHARSFSLIWCAVFSV